MKFKEITLAVSISILIGLILFTNKNLNITGYSIYPGGNISTNVERLYNWEPLGSYPNYEFQNKVGYDLNNQRYFFTYNGPNLNMTYFLYFNNNSPLGIIKTNLSYSNTTFYFTPSESDIEINLNGSYYNLSNFIPSNITHSINYENKVNILKEYIFNNISIIINSTYLINGKTLKVKLESNNSVVSMISLGKTGSEPPSEKVITDISYHSNYVYNLIKKGDIFFSIYNDVGISKSTRLEYKKPFKESDYVSNFNTYIYYDSNSNLNNNKLNEVLYLVISEDILDLMPNNPNQKSLYKDYLINKTILDFWGTNNNQSLTYSNKLYNYGFEDLLINFLSRKWPYDELISNLSLLNYDTISYSIYIDCYIDDSSCFQESYVQQYKNGSYIPAHFSSTRGQSYALRYNRHKLIAQNSEPLIKNQGQKGIFLDAVGANLPWKYVDQNGTIPIGANSSYLFNIEYQKQVIEYLHNLYLGPVLTEGVNPLYWIGEVDSIEGSSSFLDSEKDNLILDLNLEVFHPKTVMYGGYYRRFFDGANNNISWKGINSNNYDKYMATHIAFGHLGMIDSTAPWLHNVSDKLVVRYYYMTKALQKQYAPYNATEIKYYSGNQWKTLSDAIRDSYDFVNAQVKVVYNNGLNLYVNRHSSSNLIINYNSKDYILPPNGWLAYNNNDGFFEFSGLQNGHKIDIVESSDYTYIDSRDSIETINIKQKKYNLYIFNFTNGSLQIYNSSINISNLTLKQPVKLDAISPTSTNIRNNVVLNYESQSVTQPPSSTSSSGGNGGFAKSTLQNTANTINNLSGYVKDQNLTDQLNDLLNLNKDEVTKEESRTEFKISKEVALNSSLIILALLICVSLYVFYKRKDILFGKNK